MLAPCDTINLSKVTCPGAFHQVVDVFADERDGRAAPLCRHAGGQRLQTAGREVAPALGLAWATCVTQRLFLSRCPGAAAAEGPSGAEGESMRGGGGGVGGGGPPQPVLRCMQARALLLAAAVLAGNACSMCSSCDASVLSC